MVQFSYPYVTTGKTMALTIQRPLSGLFLWVRCLVWCGAYVFNPGNHSVGLVILSNKWNNWPRIPELTLIHWPLAMYFWFFFFFLHFWATNAFCFQLCAKSINSWALKWHLARSLFVWINACMWYVCNCCSTPFLHPDSSVEIQCIVL